MPFDTNSEHVHEADVRIRTPQAALDGTLAVGNSPLGVVVFAHGSGSSRHSSRNRFVADHLQRQRLATLLFDLLTPEEERIDQLTGHLRFDIDLLAQRLIDAVTWLDQQDETRGLPIGYFGASTGGGAALVAAAQQADRRLAMQAGGDMVEPARAKADGGFGLRNVERGQPHGRFCNAGRRGRLGRNPLKRRGATGVQPQPFLALPVHRDRQEIAVVERLQRQHGVGFRRRTFSQRRI